MVSFIGPNDGQGLRIYYDGVEARNSRPDRSPSRKSNSTIQRNSERGIVIGRFNYKIDQLYASVQVDEMFFFNQALTETEITSLSQYRNSP